jgi:tight adherence protein B
MAADGWVIAAIALGGAVAAFSLALAIGRLLLARYLARRRLARFLDLSAPLAEGAASGAITTALPTAQRLAAILASPNASMALIAVGAVGALGSLLLGFTPGLILAIAALVAGGVFMLRGGNRRDRLEEQLVPALQVMATAMESGYSVQQAVDRVVRDAPPPISEEFAQVARAIELGTTLQASLEGLASRVASENFEFFATIVAMQYRVGGDLPTLLASLATRIQERLELKAEIKALTAQARYSGWVLAILPFAVAGLLIVANPAYVLPLVDTSLGRNLLLFAGGLLVAGLASIRAISQVEV